MLQKKTKGTTRQKPFPIYMQFAIITDTYICFVRIDEMRWR